MVQYLSKFLDQLSDILKPLRELTKKDQPFIWSEECKEHFESVKRMITTTPVLAYYDPNQQLEIQVDSSKDGLGVVLLQNGQPIEFASRTLTEPEQRWAQIEKEMLAVVYGLERFDQYTYGRKVQVITDHKPLENIMKKPLCQAPRRLQGLLMRSNRYDFDLKWMQGSSLVIADTLSRAALQCVTSETEPITDSYLPDCMLERIRMETSEDKTLQDLSECIINGWPTTKSDVPENLAPYYKLKDSLSIENGLIVKGERIVIPDSMRKEMKGRLHSAHLAKDSMVRRARQTIFWPGIIDEIKQIAETCETCQQSKLKNQKESLKQHGKGTAF